MGEPLHLVVTQARSVEDDGNGVAPVGNGGEDVDLGEPAVHAVSVAEVAAPPVRSRWFVESSAEIEDQPRLDVAALDLQHRLVHVLELSRFADDVRPALGVELERLA